MSSRITVFPHPLTSERQVLIVEPGITLRKAFKQAFPSIPIEQYSFYEKNNRIVDIDVPLTDDTFVIARIEPQGNASYWNTVGSMASIFLGVILTASGVFADVGVGLIIGGVVGLVQTIFNKSVTTHTSLSRPGINGGKNTTNPNGKLPWVIGTHLITPYYAAAPYTSIEGTDGEQEYLHLLYAVGYSKLALTQLKLGTKLLASNDNPTVMNGAVTVDGNFAIANASIEIQQEGAIPSLYDTSGYTIKETSLDTDLAGFRNSVSNADIDGGELGGLTITVNSSSKTIYRSAGNWGTAGVNIGDMITLIGMSNAGNGYPMLVTNVSGSTLTCYDATNLVNETHASVSVNVAPGNIVETAERVRKLSWTIEFPNGLVKWNGNTAQDYSVIVRAYYRKKGDPDSAWITAPGWVTPAGSVMTITRNKYITMRFTAMTGDLGATYTGKYETRVVVEQPQANNSDTYTYVEDCTWSSLRTYHDVNPVASRVADKTVLVAMKIRASYQLKNTIDAFNVIATPVLTRDGAGTDEAYIRALPNNPAAAFVHACMDSVNPRPCPASLLDFAALRTWADNCTSLGIECNGLITSGESMRTILQQIAACGRAVFYRKDSLYSVAADFAKTATVAHITPRNSWDFSYTKSLEALPHGFRIPFLNKEEDYESDERIVLGDGYIYDVDGIGKLVDAFGTEHTTSEEYRPGRNYIEATEFEELAAPYATLPDQVWKIGRYEWECRKYCGAVYSVNMDIEQLVMTIGDKVRFSHPALSRVMYSARVVDQIHDQAGDVLGVRLDAPVTVSDTYGCRIRTIATSFYRAITNGPGETDTLYFATAIAINGAPSPGDLVMVGPAGEETVALVVRNIQFNDDYSALLTLTPYAEEVFAADDDTPSDFYSKIIKAGGSVVSSALSSDEYAQTIADKQGDSVSISSSYTKYLNDLMQTQVDRAIVYYTQSADPSSDWTTEALKNEHIGDYWRSATSAVWYQWSGTSWVEISDPAAQSAANAAQTTADTKVTVWQNLAAAQTSAEANDLFLASGLLYRCLTALAATYERITPKRWPDAEVLPVAVTHEPLLTGDTFYKTNDKQWYIYTTEWETDGEAQLVAGDITTIAPRYKGLYNAEHPTSYNNDDWWVVYDTDDSPIQRGVWYSNSGTPTRISSVYGETGYTTDAALLAKLPSTLAAIAWAEKSGQGTASNYGVAVFYESLAAVTAFVQNLYVEHLSGADGTFTGTLVGNTIQASSAIYSSDGHLAIMGDSTSEVFGDGLCIASYNQKTTSPSDGDILLSENLWGGNSSFGYSYVGVVREMLTRESGAWSTLSSRSFRELIKWIPNSNMLYSARVGYGGASATMSLLSAASAEAGFTVADSTDTADLSLYSTALIASTVPIASRTTTATSTTYTNWFAPVNEVGLIAYTNSGNADLWGYIAYSRNIVLTRLVGGSTYVQSSGGYIQIKTNNTNNPMAFYNIILSKKA